MKMNKYAQTALLAVELITSKVSFNPADAWKMASIKIFDSLSSQVKACPKNTFLAICETERVKGVQPGNYTRSTKNKEYALKALNLLDNNPALSNELKHLWEVVQQGKIIKDNSQMDVVLALWNKGLIN